MFCDGAPPSTTVHSPGRVLLKVQQGAIHRRPHLFFMAFGQFPCHLQRTVSSAVVLEFLEQRDQAVRRFDSTVVRGSWLMASRRARRSLPLAQKSFEAEASAGQAAAH